MGEATWDGTYVGGAMRDGAVATDARGLMPLDEARAVVAAAARYVKGEGTMVGGTFVLESDRLWAALLSLEDAEEFVAHATRIEWVFPGVRGMDNVAPAQRYGVGILPWLRSRLQPDGSLLNVPWCVVPCLLALDGVEALQLALEARATTAEVSAGPGPYAVDGKGESTTLEEGFDVARQWLIAHPDGEALLEELDDPRAGALLEELRASRSLPDALEAMLAEAETLAEPPMGPPWSIDVLDAAAADFDLPLWDNLHYTCVAMRITGFASAAGDALVIESIVHNPGASMPVAWELRAYGPGATRSAAEQLLVDDGHLAWIELKDGEVDPYTGALLREHGPVYSPIPVEQHVFDLDGVEVRLDHRLPPSFAAYAEEEVRQVSPGEGLALSLVRRYPDRAFASEAQLREAAELVDDAVRLFAFERFHYVRAGESARTSLDLRLLVEALRRRCAIDELPGEANSFAEHWLVELAADRCYVGDDAWGEAVVNQWPHEGVGLSPYVNEQLRLGWPHAVMLQHGAGQNGAVGQDRVTQLLARADDGLGLVVWPRDTAATWARAVAMAEEALAEGDPGVVQARERHGLPRVEETYELVARFVRAAPASQPAHAAAGLPLLLEALVGPDVVVAAFAAALEEVSPFLDDHPPLARAVFELGFVLRRVLPWSVGGRLDAAGARAKLEEVCPEEVANDVGRALHLVLGGRPAAERFATHEIDYAHVDDHAWAATRLLEAAPSLPDAYLVSIAGEGLLDRYADRVASTDHPRALVTSIGALKSSKAAALLAAAWVHEEARDAIVDAFRRRPPDQLEALRRGPHGEAASAVLAALAG